MTKFPFARWPASVAALLCHSGRWLTEAAVYDESLDNPSIESTFTTQNKAKNVQAMARLPKGIARVPPQILINLCCLQHDLQKVHDFQAAG